MKWSSVLVMSIFLGLTACAPQQSTIETAIAQTQAAEGQFATALAGTLAAVSPPTAAPLPTATPAPALEASQPIATKPPSYDPGTIPLTYGQKVSSLPRQRTVVYGFQGNEGEVVRVNFALDRAAKHEFCFGRGQALNYALKSDQGDILDQSGVRETGGVERISTLPYTGVYYINMTCNGSGCDGFCAEMSLAVNTK